MKKTILIIFFILTGFLLSGCCGESTDKNVVDIKIIPRVHNWAIMEKECLDYFYEQGYTRDTHYYKIRCGNGCGCYIYESGF